PEARVMFLHNHLFSNGLYNGSIEVVLEIFDEENIIVAFPLAQEISCEKLSNVNDVKHKTGTSSISSNSSITSSSPVTSSPSTLLRLTLTIIFNF
ncbi:10302_t:CDS:2, partial [Diversispora eburnea]